MRVNNTDSLFDFLTLLESEVAEGKDGGRQYNVETNKGTLVTCVEIFISASYFCTNQSFVTVMRSNLSEETFPAG